MDTALRPNNRLSRIRLSQVLVYMHPRHLRLCVLVCIRLPRLPLFNRADISAERPH
ncbi:MAG: hypothetical protein IPK53_11220 [bacterium]|nr:hypothetical protein [bacterium]